MSQIVEPPDATQVQKLFPSKKHFINPVKTARTTFRGPLIIAKCSHRGCKIPGYRNYYYCKRHLNQVLGLAIRRCKYGFGLFTTKSFKKDDCIGKFGGVIISPSDLCKRYGRTCAPYAISINSKKVSDELYIRSPLAYANDVVDVNELFGRKLTKEEFTKAYEQASKVHSNNCACYSHKGEVFMVARRTIRAGEELRWPYGPTYWWIK
jgi:hypothetical protein